MLPIDVQLPEIVEALRTHRTLLLSAPPGAGKTTRLPPALLSACSGEIVVLEPRRLAARLAATRVASDLGEAVGGICGYSVRYESKVSARTRIRFVTEGVLTRQLIADPELRGVSAVLLDEFHERHVQGDLALALLRRLRERRPELMVGVLSATLATENLARFLGDAPLIRTEGRAHPVLVTHAPSKDDRPLELQIVSALRQLVRDGLKGHVLVFLPGAREIRLAQSAAAKLAAEHDLALLPLYGDLSPDEQDRALAPSTRRKILLSTNIAESSVTIDGVEAVVDAGLVRKARHDPWLLLSELVLGQCSRASAIQRAGRAGRQGPGKAVRLYTEAEFAARPEFDDPEILHTDLAPVALDLAAAHATGTELLDSPGEAPMQAARTLLTRLSLLDEAGVITALGRRAARLPLHPRLGRFLLEAEQRHVPQRAAVLAAILSERDPRVRTRELGRDDPVEDSDAEALADRFEEASHSRFQAHALRAMQLDAGTVHRIERARRSLTTQIRGSDEGYPSEITAALAVAFFDRIAKRRVQGSRDLAMAGGFVCELAETSAVRDAPFVICLQGEKRKKPLIRSAHRIEPELLLELFPERIEERVRARFDAASGRVIARSEMLYEGVVLDDSPAPHGPESVRLLVEAALARGLHTLLDADALENWRARAEIAAKRNPDVVAPDDAAIEAALCEIAENATRLDELADAGLLALIRANTQGGAAVDRLVPERLTLPSGRAAKITYARGQAPWVESYLQDFCGLTATPEVAGERVVVHLLAPNRRPVQITQDLPSFWKNHYPELRKALSRRYPRHEWPTDPSTPVPAKHRF